jgi:hypothetical protein
MVTEVLYDLLVGGICTASDWLTSIRDTGEDVWDDLLDIWLKGLAKREGKGFVQKQARHQSQRIRLLASKALLLHYSNHVPLLEELHTHAFDYASTRKGCSSELSLNLSFSEDLELLSEDLLASILEES